MKISYNWLKQYLVLDHDPAYIAEILTNIGLEVEGISAFESIPGGLEGIIVGQVLTCEKHPNADNLSLTTVDYGQGAVQIVCGAPNVRTNQKVLVATVGSKIYPIEGEPFVIKKAKIRGEASFGMICAEDELGLGSSHDGIIVLPDSTQVGTPAKDLYDIELDTIFDIALTPNRSDATAHFGVAKDLYAYLKVNEDYRHKIKSPSTDKFHIYHKQYPIKIHLEEEIGCPRYTGVILSNVEVKASPTWLQNRLKSIGVRPINNIVDATNYVLHEYGQPLHAYDADKIGASTIRVKTLPQGSEFVTLDGISRKMEAHDLMICDGDSKGMCIAGVFGGATSGVTQSTQTIFLEAAHFHPKWIRKTSMNHLLRTDAALCFEKGTDPNQIIVALKRATILIQELASGKVTSDIIDIYPNKIEPVQVEVRYQKINSLLGIELTKSEIRDILHALDIGIENASGSAVSVKVPTNKMDVTREVDIIEEILRIYGFNKIETDKKISYNFGDSDFPSPHYLYNKIANHLASKGYHECMSLSLSESRLYDTWASTDRTLVHINNTSNVHLDIMRPGMIPSLLQNIVHNQNRQNNNLRLFEFGKTYEKNSEEGFVETDHLTIGLTGQRIEKTWTADPSAFTFYSIKSILLQIVQLMGITHFDEKALEGHHYLSEGVGLWVQNKCIAEAGVLHDKLASAADIRNQVFLADIYWQELLALSKERSVEVQGIPKYPSSQRDLALILPNEVTYAEVLNSIKQSGAKNIVEIGLFDVFVNQDLSDKNQKSYAIYLIFQHASRTLQDQDIDKSIQKILTHLERDFAITLR